MSLATVYRILGSLEREGMVRRVSTAEGVCRFDANLTRHQHLCCRACGRMTDFDGESLARLRLPRFGAAGFVAEEFDIRIVGICEDCRRTSAVRRAGTGSVKNTIGKLKASRKNQEGKWRN